MLLHIGPIQLVQSGLSAVWQAVHTVRHHYRLTPKNVKMHPRECDSRPDDYGQSSACGLLIGLFIGLLIVTYTLCTV